MQKCANNNDEDFSFLESNVTDLYDVIGYLEYDVGNAYNFTQRLFESIQDQESRIEQLNQSLAYDVRILHEFHSSYLLIPVYLVAYLSSYPHLFRESD